MTEELQALLTLGGVMVEAEGYEKLAVYHAMLLEWNKHIDLTNVPPEEMALRHYADSLLPLGFRGLFQEGASMIDVGSGAGFPGLPIAIARPDMRICLLDAMNKRCDFLRAVCQELKLSNVTVLHARAEDAARAEHRERYDIASARAVASLPVLAEYLLPFAKIGGAAICWKGPAVKDELEAAQRACALLGGRMGELYHLPIEGREHYIQVLLKTGKTAKQYPRKSGTPAKLPLGGN